MMANSGCGARQPDYEVALASQGLEIISAKIIK